MWEVWGLAAVRHFLSRYDNLIGSPPCGRVDVARVRERTAVAHRAYQAARYESVVADLPALLAAADAFHQRTDADERRSALLEYVAAYALAAKLLTKMGAGDLARLVADRCATAAVEADSTEARGIAAYQVACALLRVEQPGDAECVAVTMAELVHRGAGRDKPVLVSVAGSLWLLSAIVAARRGDRGEAWRRLDIAERLAGILGQDANFAWTAFGTTNVAIHRVSVAAELGDPAAAVRASDAVDTDRLPAELNSRRAQVHLDLAWAQAHRRRDAEAVLHLLEAERVAPEAVRYNVLVGEIVREMLARQKRSKTSALHDMAVRAGVLE